MGARFLVVTLFAIGCGTPANESPPATTTTTPPPVVFTSPGPLALGHAQLDSTAGCMGCHVSGSPQIANDKCLGCHQDLAQRIAATQGFHASVVVRGKTCSTCHLDHKGRGYDAMGWKSLTGGMAGF